MLPSPDELGLRALRAALDALAAAGDPDTHPLVACARAAAQLTGAQHASLTVISAAHPPQTLAATDPIATDIDTAQYETAGGPCLDAAEKQVLVTAEFADDDRWPQLRRRLVGHSPVRFVVSHPLTPRPTGYGGGSLNLYSAERLSTGPATDLAASLCSAAVNALGERHRADNLELALRSARAIGAAVGVLMAQRKVTYADAFDLLRQHSQSSHRKLRDIADDVLLTGDLLAEEKG